VRNWRQRVNVDGSSRPVHLSALVSPREVGFRVDIRHLLVLLLCSLVAGSAFAQSPDKESGEKEPVAIAELGAALSWNIKNGGSSAGPTVAVETTAKEHWLELELGVTPLFARDLREWDTDLLFKKPWTLSRKVEFMAGVGPAWVHSRQHGIITNSVSGEAALDFMFWPSKKRRFGWYLEPGYEYNFAKGHEQSMGITGGLLIAIP
jgi:hypothetical protein